MLQHLPIEILSKIYNYLYPDDKIKLRTQCKLLYRVADNPLSWDNVRSVTICSGCVAPSRNSIIYSFSKCRKLYWINVELDKYQLNVAFLKDIVNKFRTNFSKITKISYYCTDSEVGEFSSFLDLFKDQLTHIQLSDKYHDGKIRHIRFGFFSKLQHLDLRNLRIKTEDLREILTGSDIRSLIIDDYRFLPLMETKLETLHTTGMIETGDNDVYMYFIIELIRCNKHLEYIQLTDKCSWCLISIAFDPTYKDRKLVVDCTCYNITQEGTDSYVRNKLANLESKLVDIEHRTEGSTIYSHNKTIKITVII